MPCSSGDVLLLPRLLPRPFGERAGVRGRWRWIVCCCLLLLWFCVRSLAGICARQRTSFSCTHKKRRQKVAKRGSLTSRSEVMRTQSAPTSATPALRFGANLRRNACGVRRRTHCALTRSVQTTAASQTTKRVHAALHAPPRKRCAAGAASRGWKDHSDHRCARPQCRLLLGPSAAMARVGVHPPLWPCREAQGLGRAWAAQHAHAS